MTTYFVLFFHIWRVVDLLRRNQRWWSPVISSAYGINDDRKMLGRILYVFNNSNMLQ
jgi:hypothetical protein